MLRNTGFFRGIDCPFYTEHGQGKDGRNGCNRPYCHFRHSHYRRPSYGAQADVKKQKDLQSAQNGTENDECLTILRNMFFVVVYLFIYLWASMSSPAVKLTVKGKCGVDLCGANVPKLCFSSSFRSFTVGD